MNRNDVIDVLRAVQAGTGRTMGEPEIVLWQSVLGECPKDFALAAVLAHFKERPGVWLEPGHVWSRWRDHRRDQLAREDEPARLARQAALDARLAGVDELAAAKAIPADTPATHIRPSTQYGANPLTVQCPWCRAAVGRPCTNTATKKHTNPHPARVEAVTPQEESA